jgi:hypothetical protein
VEARTRRIASLAIWALVLTILVPLAGLVGAAPAKALVTDGFDPGYIISDEKFYDSGSMTNSDVHNFLQAKGAKCTSNCLKDYRMATTSRDPVAGRCNGYTGKSSENVANIVKNVAVSCGINPQVLLVMLEKEQGLVTATSPSTSRYTIAMGYACPDTAACDTRYYGFFNQVYMAAYQYKVYATSPSSFRYRAGQNNSIQWHPNASCGSSTVYIRNQATASLYNYTPYRPNAAALANPYGTGNSCSSYGNRNFFVKFTDWFGTTTSASPEGRINSTSVEPGWVTITGWALDQDTADPITVDLYVNGRYFRNARADVSRPDVAEAFPGYGDKHGFNVRLNLPPGEKEVCVYGINAGGGKNTLIACRTVTAMSGDPVGVLDKVQLETGGVRVTGTALDPDTLAAADVVFTFKGTRVGALKANQASPALDGYPAYSGNRAFYGLVNAPNGVGELCATVVNVLQGGDRSLGCRTITVFGPDPNGRVNSTVLGPGFARVTGWVLDRDSVAPVTVNVLVNGKKAATASASQARPDVLAAYPAYGSARGYVVDVPLPAGTPQVCVEAVNIGAGQNVTLGCSTVTTPTGPPVLVVESTVRTATGYTFTGYAMDPDTASPVALSAVSGSGAVMASTTANRSRPDRGAAYPLYGADQGFSITVPLGATSADFCLVAKNVGAGSDATSCTRFGPNPVGDVNSATAVPGGFSLSGWGLDPDSSGPIVVDVYVDGAYAGNARANGNRPDVGSAYPAYGSAHGYTTTVPATPGTHRVCVYGINVGAGKNALLDCTTVTVRGGSPDGRINSVSLQGTTATVTGWAVDFDTASPIGVHVYVDGKKVVEARADLDRPDVEAAYPGWGRQHGYSVPITLSPGTHSVCVYGIDVGRGGDASLGCKSVTVR